MCNSSIERECAPKKRPSWYKRILVVLIALFAALVSHIFLRPRQLDVMFDATAVTLQGIKGLRGDGGETPALNSDFLQRIDRILLFKADQPVQLWQRTSDPAASVAKHAMYFRPGAQRSCDGLRLQPSKAEEGKDDHVLSLFVESTGTGPCSLRLNWETGKLADIELPKGSRVDFLPLHPADPPTSERPSPLILMEYLEPVRLHAQMHGEIAGVDAPFSCRRGHSFELSGLSLEIVSIGIAGSAKDPLLTTWARASAVTTYTIDRSHCAPGFYLAGGPRMLLPWVLFLFVLGGLWKIWGKE